MFCLSVQSIQLDLAPQEVLLIFFNSTNILHQPQVQVLLGLARYDGDSRRDKATVVKLATTFLKAQQVSIK